MNDFKLLSAQVRLKVPFHDVDSMRVAWHGHYLKYFEIARCHLLDEIGYNYNEMSESGFAWPVIDVSARYVKPLLFGQDIIVEATLVEVENRLKIKYLISDAETGQRHAKGHTIQVAVDMATQEMLFESPAVLFEKLRGKS